jgi:ornithine decarboxylase
LDFILEPGRYLVADHGAIRAHVSRLSTRQQLTGERERWLYLSCGKFNGLYEMDQLQYELVFPSHAGGEHVPAVIAGPTCDSDDTFRHEHHLVQVPEAVRSGDPVWILSSGAYSLSYTTRGFNGFDPLPYRVVYRDGPQPRVRPIFDGDWDSIVALESGVYAKSELSEDRAALESRGRASPSTSFVLDDGERIVGYLLALPYPMFRYPDLTRVEGDVVASDNLHLHDLVIGDDFRGNGFARRLLRQLTETAGSQGYERISLVAVGGSDSFWSAHGYRAHPEVTLPGSYGANAVYMSREIERRPSPAEREG